MPRLFGVALFRLNAIGYCVFRKNTAALVFVRLILRAASCRVCTVWIAFAGLISFAVNLYYIWVHYYICGQFLLHLWSVITFVASTQGEQLKRAWHFFPWWPLESQSSLFGPRLELVYNCTSVSVSEKPSRYGQDSIHSPQFVVSSVFDQFSDLDLRHNIFKNLPWARCFGWFHFWDSHPTMTLYSEKREKM